MSTRQRTEPREGSRDNVRNNVESQSGRGKEEKGRQVVEIESRGSFRVVEIRKARVGNGARHESFMQYTEVFGAIYNRDKHVFPIRTTVLLLYRRESSDRDRFSGIVSEARRIAATGYGGGQHAISRVAGCATIKGFDSFIALCYRALIWGSRVVYLVEGDVSL